MSAAGFPHVFRPSAIGRVRLANRIVFLPHFTALGSTAGRPTADHAAYYAERARGGVGLIVSESQAVHPSGKMSRRFIDAWDPDVVPAYRAVTDAVHAAGVPIFAQLTHGGHTSAEKPPLLLWAPTQMPEPSSTHTTKAMDEDDIRETIAAFAAAARNQVDGGFDGIEVKVAHDGLLRSFASPHFNRRTDRYGGTFDNRMRLAVEVFEAIREEVGDGVPVGVRLCLHEHTRGGYGLDYGLRMAEHLEARRLVDYFDADQGSYATTWIEIPPAAMPEGAFRDLSAALTRQSDLPVIAAGRIKRPEMAEEILAGGEADLVGMARQLIADPHTVRKMAEGRADEVRLCIGCNDACVAQTSQEKAIRCVHNPFAGRERVLAESSLERARQRRSVLVVGGGPAGLKTAEIAARRGHRVRLLEREAELGGLVRLAARQPYRSEIAAVVDHLALACDRLGVEVETDAPVDPALAAELADDADVVVVATGSAPHLPFRPAPAGGSWRDDGSVSRSLGRQVDPPLPGLDAPCVLDVDAILRGDASPGERVLVYDALGSWQAVGTAEHLAERGHRVLLATPAPMIGALLDYGGRVLFLERAVALDLELAPGLALDSVDAGGALLRGAHDHRPRRVDVDTVVPVLPRRSREDLFLLLRELVPAGTRLVRVGDCVAPRFLQAVIAEATSLAYELDEAPVEVAVER